MTYDKKKYQEDHEKTWGSFVKLSIRGSIIIIITLTLMAFFLTN